jgi:SAM-dependent methyltransferase
VKLEDSLWTEKWSKEPFPPINTNYLTQTGVSHDAEGNLYIICVPAGYGVDAEPKASLCFASFAEAMGGNFKEGMSLLDYGCGSARMCNFMSKRLREFTYYGVEPDSPFGNSGIDTAAYYFGHDERVRVGFIGSDLEREAIDKADIALLLSIFTHTDIEETEQILRKLCPIIQRDGKIVFSVMLGESYALIGGRGAYTMQNTVCIVYNTAQQIEELGQKLGCTMRLVGDFLADGGYLHSIYEATRPPTYAIIGA